MGKNNNHQHSYVQVLLSSFRYLWFGQIGAQLATNMMLFVLAIRAYQITGSNVAVSGLFLAYSVPSLIFGMLAGVIVDHLDKRAVLSITSIIRAVLVLGLFLYPRNIVIVYVIACINAIITQFYIPAEAPLIPRLVPDRLLVSANSLFSFTFYSSMSMGFILAGPMLRLVGPKGTFLTISLMYLIAAASTMQLPVQKEKVAGLTRALSHSLLYITRRTLVSLDEGIRAVLRSSKLTEAIFLLSGTQVVLAILGSLGPGFADQVLHIDVRDASVIILAPAVVGILVGAVWIGSYGFRFKSTTLINTGVTTGGILLMLISFVLRFGKGSVTNWLFSQNMVIVLSLVLFFLLGLANSLLDVPSNSILQKEAEGEMRGRIYGILAAAVGGIGILPVVAGGILADSLGVGRVLLGVGGIIFAYGVYRIRYNKA